MWSCGLFYILVHGFIHEKMTKTWFISYMKFHMNSVTPGPSLFIYTNQIPLFFRPFFIHGSVCVKNIASSPSNSTYIISYWMKAE